jgi:hypothetical protein
VQTAGPVCGVRPHPEPGWNAGGFPPRPLIRLHPMVNHGRRAAIFLCRKVWGDRYHARALGTPREVRHAIAYVLLNFRKHLRAPAGIDPRSSGPWFDGCTQPALLPPSSAPSPTVAPRTWLAAVGWRRAGLIDIRAAPPPSNRR